MAMTKLPRVNEVVQAVLNINGITPLEIGRRDRNNFAYYRGLACWACREMTDASWQEIARATGMNAHSAAQHHHRHFPERSGTDDFARERLMVRLAREIERMRSCESL